MIFNSLCVDVKVLLFALELLFKFHLGLQVVIVILLLSAELVLDVLIRCLDHLLISKQLFNLRSLLSIELVLETFPLDFFLGSQVGLQFLIFAIRELPLFNQLVSL